ncbi:MFS transporter [Labrys neptuniae]
MKDNHSTSRAPAYITTEMYRPSYQPILIGALSNTLEWYDFIVYATMSEYISDNFFIFDNKRDALHVTLTLFGMSFIARPLGGIAIGRFGDAIGRKPALLLSMGIMTIATTAIGFLPGHASLGVAAPVCLLIARLAQGFSAGGEWGVALSFISEWSPPGQRGVRMSFLSLTVTLGSLMASGISAILMTQLSPTQMLDWGWRVPFLLGGAAGSVMFGLRYFADETPIFQAHMTNSRHRKARTRNISVGKLLLASGFSLNWTVSYYIFIVYLPIFARTHTNIRSDHATWSNAITLISIAFLIPLIGALSDKYGRLPFFRMSCLAVITFAAPAFWLIVAFESLAGTILAQLTLGVAIALYSGPGPALLAELFPTESRSLGAGLSYALTATIFGGFAPLIADWSITLTGSIYAPAVYAMMAACVSLAAISFLPETAASQLT